MAGRGPPTRGSTDDRRDGAAKGPTGRVEPPPGQLLEVADPGVGSHDHPGAGDLGPPAEVQVLAHGHDLRVEPAELGEQVAPHERAPARRHEDVADGVVLAVVDLAGLEAVDHRSSLVGRHPHVEEPVGVVPADDLGRDDRRRWTGTPPPPAGGRRRATGPRRRGRRGSTPPRRPWRGPRCRRPVAGSVLEPAHEGGGQHRRHPGRQVLPAGLVEHQDGQLARSPALPARPATPRTRARDRGRRRLPRPAVPGNPSGPEAIGPEPPVGKSQVSARRRRGSGPRGACKCL